MPKIKILELEQRAKDGLEFSFTLPAETVQPMLANCKLLSLVSVRGNVVDIGDSYEISGEISYEKGFACDRCLKEVKEQEKIPFTEKLSKDLLRGKQSDLIKDDFLNLTDLVRDNIVVAQPISNLCKEDCKGLCPKCGFDLNEGDCGCDCEIIDERLAILKSLLKDKAQTDG